METQRNSGVIFLFLSIFIEFLQKILHKCDFWSFLLLHSTQQNLFICTDFQRLNYFQNSSQYCFIFNNKHKLLFRICSKHNICWIFQLFCFEVHSSLFFTLFFQGNCWKCWLDQGKQIPFLFAILWSLFRCFHLKTMHLMFRVLLFNKWFPSNFNSYL